MPHPAPLGRSSKQAESPIFAESPEDDLPVIGSRNRPGSGGDQAKEDPGIPPSIRTRLLNFSGLRHPLDGVREFRGRIGSLAARMRAVTGSSPPARRDAARSGPDVIEWDAISTLIRPASSTTGDASAPGIGCDNPALNWSRKTDNSAL